MTTANADWFVAQYDRYVASEGAVGAKLEDSRSEVARCYALGLENGLIERESTDVTSEGRDLFDRHVGRTRDLRRTSFRKGVEYIVDALNGGTILGPSDPIFSAAYPLGDGRDKTLGKWSQDDWRESARERNSNAVAAASAAHEYEVLAGKVIRRMQATGVTTTAGLFVAQESRAA